jgi:filamentous hemagglutinin
MLIGYVRRIVNHLGRRARAAQSNRPGAYFRPRLETLEERLAPATVNYTNFAGGIWEDDANWTEAGTSLHHVPGPSDTAVIGGASGLHVTYSSGDTQIAALTLSSTNGSLDILGGTLRVASLTTGTVMVTNHFTVTVDGGSLIDQGPLASAFNVNGAAVTVNSGTLIVPGDNLTVQGNSTLTINGGSVPFTTTLINSTLNFGTSSTGVGAINVQGSCTLIGNISAGQTVVVQGTSAAPARLNVSGGGSNEGAIQLNTYSGNPVSATLAETGSGAFTNAAGGVISSANFGGISVSYAITGNLTNQGQITGGSNAPLVFSGGVYQEAGGSIGGSAWLQGASLSVTAAPPPGQPFIPLRGTCTLLGNNPADTFLQVQGTSAGGAQLNVSGGASNAGTIRLETYSGNPVSATLAETGSGDFTNAAGGVISSANFGGISVSYAITGNLTNQGQITGGSNAPLVLRSGVYREAGGSIGGSAWLQSVSFRVTAAPGTGIVPLQGTCTLLGDNLAGTFLDVQGVSAGSARLNVSGGASNAGTIR